jgi:hypothetical protein
MLPDPFYYTPHFMTGANAVDWTYVNRTFQLPAGFPNVELRHNYSISGAASGSIYLDDLFFRQIPNPAASNWTTLVAFGSSWRYATNTPAPNWFASQFDDTKWLLGKAKFGAGSGPANIVTRLPQLIPNYYFRKTFYLSSTNIQELLLSATCTDVSISRIYPIKLFLNGHMVPSTIDTVTMQGNEVRYFDLVPFASFLQPGLNTIAAQIGNTWSDYDDVAFDLSLQAIIYQPLSPRLTVESVDSSDTVLSSEGPGGTIWHLQACDALSQQGWQTLQIFTNASGGVQTFRDSGGGLLPGKTSSRFYRLTPY